VDNEERDFSSEWRSGSAGEKGRETARCADHALSYDLLFIDFINIIYCD
jgi:hypothetical protein